MKRATRAPTWCASPTPTPPPTTRRRCTSKSTTRSVSFSPARWITRRCWPIPTHASEILGGQVRALKAQGFDGLKLIEGKPQVRKLLPIPLDGPQYAGLWAALEEEQFPVVFHVGDPDEFWDPERCPDWARQSGWDYSDGSFPSKEDLYAEVDHILERHPNLKITFAHFYFLSNEMERAARFLDAHPSVCFDLAPHVDMYRDFSRDPAAARAFFLRYAERILYGTDMDTRVLARGPDGLRLHAQHPLVDPLVPRNARGVSVQRQGSITAWGCPSPCWSRFTTPILSGCIASDWIEWCLSEIWK